MSRWPTRVSFWTALRNPKRYSVASDTIHPNDVPGPTDLRTFAVLLLHPEQDDRAMYREFLRHQGFAIACPKDATHALSLAPHADVVVTELRLPGSIGGIEFVARLRKNPDTHHLPIIVLTACASETCLQPALAAGCDMFLLKPCLPDRLVTEIYRSIASRTLPKPLPARALMHTPHRRAAS
jgi:CheY-like chemotaxis protein